MKNYSTRIESRLRLSLISAACLGLAVGPWGCGSSSEFNGSGGSGTSASGGRSQGGAAGGHLGSSGAGLGGLGVAGTSAAGSAAGGVSNGGGSTAGGGSNAGAVGSSGSTSIGGASGAGGSGTVKCGSRPPPVTFSKNTWETTQSLGNIIHGTAIVTSTSGLVHVPYNLDSDRNQLRYLRSTDGGAKWDNARDLITDMGAFCFECSPRQHPIVGAAADPSGKTVAITWTSRMSGGQGDDDVWLLFSKDGGETWTKPPRVNDNATASRQFQSWVAVDACQRVHVAWTDLRNGKNEVWYARSSEPTQGFAPNLQVTDGSGAATTDFLGDYKGLAVSGSDVVVVWNDTRRDSGDIYFSRANVAAVVFRLGNEVARSDQIRVPVRGVFVRKLGAGSSGAPWIARDEGLGAIHPIRNVRGWIYRLAIAGRWSNKKRPGERAFHSHF